MWFKEGKWIDPDGVDILKKKIKEFNQEHKEDLHDYEVILKDLVPKNKLEDYILNERRKLKSKISGIDYSINSHKKEIERLEKSKEHLKHKDNRYWRMLLDE